MGDVTALMMDCITEKSGHALVPMAVSVCLMPAAPAPLGGAGPLKRLVEVTVRGARA